MNELEIRKDILGLTLLLVVLLVVTNISFAMQLDMIHDELIDIKELTKENK
jgi:hypothetical protein